MSADDDRPVEPVEHTLARIEASAGLVTEVLAELRDNPCRHCSAVVKVLSVRPGTGLARALAIEHEGGCPDADE